MDGIHDWENRFFNTLPLSSLLQETDMRFRQAVIAALIKEGFELDGAFPWVHACRKDTLDSTCSFFH